MRIRNSQFTGQRSGKDRISLISNLKFQIVPLILALVVSAAYAADARPPAVAGQFYPTDPAKLRLAIEQFLKGSTPIRMEKPIAIIVPHAGYIYSGQICADAYRQVAGHQYDTVVILGVNHTAAGFHGISLGDYDAFQTPLGAVQVDRGIVGRLISGNQDCVRDRRVHVQEHSIEVQIPFIQYLFPKARIVPAVIHPPDPDICARFGLALAKVLRNRKALIVVSSDLSHYPNYGDAADIDRLTLETIASLDTTRISSVMKNLGVPNLATRACGEAGILAGITAAKELGAKRAVVAGYANSGDIPVGDRSRTVGYGAVVLAPGNAPGSTAILARRTPPLKAAPLQVQEKKALLALARETILCYLTTQTVPLARNLPARMDFPQGAFVTLRKGGDLRGCIGHIAPDIELGKTVGMVAFESAFNDSRFLPVQLNEMRDIEIEISVMTPLKPIRTPDEIVIGRDGILMSKDGVSSIFLPQVAPENKWGKTETLDNLCRKASLSLGCWKKGAAFQIFQADVFSESQFK